MYADQHLGVVAVLVVGADECMTLRIATTRLRALNRRYRDERELVQTLDHPLDESQEVGAVLIEFENRLRDEPS